MPAGERSATKRGLASPHSADSARPKNFLQACLLLFLREEPGHGYALIERLEDIGTPSDRAVVYRTLRTLEREGLVESAWEESGAGPARRRYALTASGERVLAAWAATLGRSAQLLDAYLERFSRATQEVSH